MNRDQRREWRRYVLGCADLTPAHKVVLLGLETFADFPAGTNARPGVAALAEVCGLSGRMVDYALQRGRRLKLVEQTGRANPKRGLAAVYRLLPTPISTRTSVRVETDFNTQKTVFNTQKPAVSTRTHVRATNKDSPSHNTKAEKAGAPEGAHVPAVPTQHSRDATSNQQRLDGRTLAQSVIPKHYPRQEILKLGEKANELLAEGIPRDTVEAALQLWLTKPDAGPGLLPSLVSEVIKNREAPRTNGHRPSTADDRVRQAQALKAKFAPISLEHE